MSKSFKDKKVHKGQIQKKENEEKKKKIEEEKEEEKQKLVWMEGAKKETGNDYRKKKEIEKIKRKEELKNAYLRENNSL